MKFKKCVWAVVAVAVVALASEVRAQVKPEDGAKFLGGWALGMETPQGAMTLTLTIKDAEGKLAGTITSDVFPESAITDISKAGEALVLKYMLDFQGMPIPAKITLTPLAEKMTVSFDFADGQFMIDGTATKK
jgi:hypothetical protein